MTKSVVEYLVEKILCDVDKYDDEGNVIGIEYWNAFHSCTDLSEYVKKAKEMEKQQKLEKQLFIGKVSEIIGFDKTLELLRESKQAIEEI
jgi:hypothetical protein